MKKTTTWHPDTCSCILRYEWDTDVPEAERVHTPVEHVHVCDLHAHEDHQEAFKRAHDDNLHKNHAVALFSDEHSTATAAYDEHRVLQIRHGLGWVAANNAQRELEKRFPTHKRAVKPHVK